MRARIALLATGVLLLAPIGSRCAEPPAAAPRADSGSCGEAAGQAERTWNLPDGLLAAIGRVESGRPDPGTGQLEPSRWAINVGGEGRFFDTEAAAVAYVQNLEARGIRSIDVGCFQVNLMYHPAAFASVDDAFDARANAEAAAQFLSELHQRSGDWDSAIALYHSALPERGEPYRARVLAQWRGAPPEPQRPSPAETPAGPVVVMLAPAAAGIPVFTLTSTAVPAGPLPRVFTPNGTTR